MRSELKRLTIKEQEVSNKYEKLRLEVKLIEALYHERDDKLEIYKFDNEIHREKESALDFQ